MEQQDRSNQISVVELSSVLIGDSTAVAHPADASNRTIDTHMESTPDVLEHQITSDSRQSATQHEKRPPPSANDDSHTPTPLSSGPDSNSTDGTKPWSQDGSASTTQNEQLEPTPMPWHPTILRSAPLAGLGALLIAVLLLFASFTVLASAKGDEVAAWKYEPNVYLAIFTAIAHRLIGFALVQGTVVTFWNRVLRGTTLGQLHRDWSYGLHVYKAILAGRYFNTLALACICATLVAVDAPLMQRSVTVHSSIPDTKVPLQINVVPEIPSYKTGKVLANDGSLFTASGLPYMHDVIKDYALSRPLHAIKGCPGTCAARVRGPALAVDTCTSTLQFVNFSVPLTPKQNTTWNVGLGHAPASRKVFDIGFEIDSGDVEKLVLQTTIAMSPGNRTCAAYVNTTRCYLVSAIAEYPVIIDHNGVKMVAPPSYPNIIQRANNTALTNHTISKHGLMNPGGLIRTTLAGIAYAGFMAFHSAEYLLPHLDIYLEYVPPAAPNTLFLFQHTVRNGGPESCIPQFSDPRDQIMAALNEVMFRVGAYWTSASNQLELEPLLDNGVGINSSVAGTVINPVNVFRVSFSYFAGAAVIELLAIGVILVTFWGWWNLGRNFSFSPLEIAKAFDAPLLQSLGCELHGRGIAKEEGLRMVKFGVVQGETVYIPDPGYIAEKVSIADRARVTGLSEQHPGPTA